ncbi:MAG: toll/interleukin-1 receptor domain-containing protein [Planctomycetaceae bacterium]
MSESSELATPVGPTSVPVGSRTGPYRVFVSYSHQDVNLVHVIVQYLVDVCGVEVIWDQTFAYGRGFHEQIRDFIAHSHVFLPVITPSSKERGWVHQEIGYAMAMNIPVLPIAIGATPEQMISMVHSIMIEPPTQKASVQDEKAHDQDEKVHENIADAFSNPVESWVWKGMIAALDKRKLDFLVERSSCSSLARYQCGDYQEERSMLMVRHSNTAFDIMLRGHLVRQLGGLSSFHIPDAEPTSEIWKIRYGMRDRTEFDRKLQRAERTSLEQHFREAGCMLLVNPYYVYESSGPRAYAVRLLSLYQFLKSTTKGSVVVILSSKVGVHESVTIVGDVFAAMAIAGSSRNGYKQTVFTTHAPSMKSRHIHFDGRLMECLVAWCHYKKWGKPIPDIASHFADPARSQADFCQATVDWACEEIEQILRKKLGVTGVDLCGNPVELTLHLADARYSEAPFDKLIKSPPAPPISV